MPFMTTSALSQKSLSGLSLRFDTALRVCQTFAVRDSRPESFGVLELQWDVWNTSEGSQRLIPIMSKLPEIREAIKELKEFRGWLHSRYLQRDRKPAKVAQSSTADRPHWVTI